jgi:hypothetical protein
VLELFGPTYRFAGEVLTQPEIIVINDHDYDEGNQCYHVEKLLENSQCDPQQHIIVMDHINHEDSLSNYHCLCLPYFVARECEQFKEQQIQTNWVNKTRTFNFMINKPRPHRELLLQLIDKFKLTNYSYSLAWQTNPVNNIPVTDYRIGPEVAMNQGLRNGSFRNAKTYQHLLQTTVFEPSCISLITEPAYYERETIHTEKTVMAIYGGTLPIWVGGWRLADFMKSLGFDVFDDIIDHGYQALADPKDRCCAAIERNLDLLRDFDRAHDFVQQNQSRLEHNLNLLKANVFLNDCFDKVEQYPEPTRSKLFSIIPRYRYNTAVTYRSLDDYQLLGKTPGAVY